MRSKLKRIAEIFLSLLYGRTILVLTVMFCVVALLAFWYFSRASQALLEATSLNGTAMYAKSIEELRTFYTSDVVERVRGHGIAVTHDYKEREAAIPLPATFSMELGRRIGARAGGISVRLYSAYPFPWRLDGGPHDDFEQQALDALQRDPGQPFYRFETLAGHPVLRYALADRMRAECLDCHNTHPQSPKRGWRLGDVRGVLEVTRSLDVPMAQHRAGIRDFVILFTGIMGIGIGMLALVITRLRHVSVELEAQVAQRTTAMAAANKELESFSYSVSHDLRAPLRGIDGFSQALLGKYADQLDARGRHYLERIRAGTQRMGQLIDDLLDLSRVTRQEIRYDTVLLSALARDITEELRRSQPQRAVEFRIRGGLQVRGDANLLRIALQNLLDNAWKFSAKHAQAIIEFGLTQQQGENVYFVRDDGAGFDMAYAGKLFGAFQRLHDETEFEGIGIGLATVQRIIHRHGGRIWAQGALEQGATFYFTLPEI